MLAVSTSTPRPTGTEGKVCVECVYVHMHARMYMDRRLKAHKS